MDQFADADEGAAAAAAAAVHAQPVAPLTAPHSPIVHARHSGEFRRVDDPDEETGVYSDQYDEDDDDEYWDSQDEAEYNAQVSSAATINDVVDQDWADAAGDFTKKFNRMRQHVTATASVATPGSASQPAARVLPAINRPKPAASSKQANGAAGEQGSNSGVHVNKVADQLAAYARFASKISVDPLYASSGQAPRKGGSERILVKDKSDRATNEQVLDPRTRLILFKMLGRGLIERIDGCVSTGKEANVYHALTPEKRHFALKIFKTSILVFKDRDRYVTGEYRFKSGYARSNPRKMVRLWAEKELRNLRRMRAAGLRVPEAIEVRENVLVMEFVGADEWQASPRLKDADLPADNLRGLYIEILVILRAIFVRCRLVHADFSEYNILYHDGHLWVIDVSQSVEQDHPAAFDFLRADIRNADEFFARRGVATLGLKRTFDYVTRDSSFSDRQESDEDMAEAAERALKQMEQDENEDAADESGATHTRPQRPSATDEAVFAQSYIPRALDDVYDVERDVAKVLRGEGEDLIYADLTGVAAIRRQGMQNDDSESKRESTEIDEAAKGLQSLAIGNEEESGTGSSDGSDSDGSDSEASQSGDDKDFVERRPRGKKHEDKEEKKKRRQETKEKAREKRTHKMKKSEKARRVKKSSGKR